MRAESLDMVLRMILSTHSEPYSEGRNSGPERAMLAFTAEGLPHHGPIVRC
jgi:hypothetical protein